MRNPWGFSSEQAVANANLEGPPSTYKGVAAFFMWSSWGELKCGATASRAKCILGYFSRGTYSFTLHSLKRGHVLDDPRKPSFSNHLKGKAPTQVKCVSNLDLVRCHWGCGHSVPVYDAVDEAHV